MKTWLVATDLSPRALERATAPRRSSSTRAFARKPDLRVVATPGESGRAHAVAGSVAEALLPRPHGDVLTVDAR